MTDVDDLDMRRDDDVDDLDDLDTIDDVDTRLDGERSLQTSDEAFGVDADVHLHDVARYGISGFSGLGLAWGTLAVVVSVFGAPVTAAPSLLLLVVWLAAWIGGAAAVNAGMGHWQRRAGRLLTSSTSTSGDATSVGVPGMRP